MSQPAFDFGDEPLDEEGSPTYSVAELAEAINAQLRRGFTDGVWVRGEIDGLRHSGPHTYFQLIEHAEQGRAVINVSLFAPMKRKLTPLLKRSRLELGNGMKVRIHGHLDFYAPNGRLGLKMAGIDPRFTLGELSQARDQVVRRLVAGGLYDANRARPQPTVPLCIGVVASSGTAAWHDFHDEIRRSGLGFHLRVCDVRVQGVDADRGIAAGITSLGRRGDVDVVVVIRGGGARNELATFDAESIAVAIGTCSLPVLTGLGHEIDRSVADEVAAAAFKTPTACAAHLVERVSSYLATAERTWTAVEAAADRRLIAAEQRLDGLARRWSGDTLGSIARADDRLRARAERLAGSAPHVLRAATDHLDRSAARVASSTHRALGDHTVRLDERGRRLALLDPANLLRRGWSITRDADGAVVSSVGQVGPGDVVSTQLADGTVTSRIEDP